MAQILGVQDLTVVLRGAEPVIVFVRIGITDRADTPPGRLTVAVTLTLIINNKAGTTDAAELVVTGHPEAREVTPQIDRTRLCKFTIDDGGCAARIRFVVPRRLVTAREMAAYEGFVAAGILLFLGFATALRIKRLVVAVIPAIAAVATFSVGVTGAVVSRSVPEPVPDGWLSNPTNGRPHVGFAAVDYSRPAAGLRLRALPGPRSIAVYLMLNDTPTGQPVDDLVVRHGTLMRLIVVGPVGNMWHVRPVRTNPGRFVVSLTIVGEASTERGIHAVGVEASRRGGGVQLIRSSFTTATVFSSFEYPSVAGPGARVVAGTHVDVRPNNLVAEPTSTISARIGHRSELQLWLGTVAHLIVVGPIGGTAADAPVWALAQVMLRPSPGIPDETFAALGSYMSFSFSLSEPGRYRLWIQAQRGYALITVPVDVDVGR